MKKKIKTKITNSGERYVITPKGEYWLKISKFRDRIEKDLPPSEYKNGFCDGLAKALDLM